MGRVKPKLAGIFDLLGLNVALLAAQRWLAGDHLRAVNYHDVPPSLAERFEAQLRFYQRHFAPVDYEGLMAFREGRWSQPRPGLMICFDDGHRGHAQVVAPLLEKYGFVGWFLVPPGFVDAQPVDQPNFAREHAIEVLSPPAADGRVALSWDEVRWLAGDHEIVCHTMNHTRLVDDLSDERLTLETVGARRRLEEEIGSPVRAFGWVGGEEWAYSADGARAVERAGFEVGLMTNNALVRPGFQPLQIQRTNVEAFMPLDLVRFQLCGFLDVMYIPKRRRVVRRTRTLTS